MNYINLSSNSYPHSKKEVKAAFPNTSFPKSFPCPTGYAEVLDIPAPAYDKHTQKYIEVAPLINNDGVYEQAYKVLDFVEEELADEKLSVAASVRAERDVLIAATDFYALSDVVMTTEMTAYRQALRAVPEQEGFPTMVTWPTAP